MAYLRWVETLLASPASRRKQWIEEIMAGFREYRTRQNPVKTRKNLSGAESKTHQYLSDVLESGNEYELVGFVPKIEYIKAEGDKDELNCVWVHPHMNPQLLYKHKKLPVFIIAGPGLRLDDSVLNEVGISRTGVRGITG